nr:hypothetical protein [Oscillatoria laete-virens]
MKTQVMLSAPYDSLVIGNFHPTPSSFRFCYCFRAHAPDLILDSDYWIQDSLCRRLPSTPHHQAAGCRFHF